MAGRAWKNTYRLTDVQLEQLDNAESLMESMDLGQAEELLLGRLGEDPNCVPVLSNLGHLYGRYLSDFEKAVEFYDKVLKIGGKKFGITKRFLKLYILEVFRFKYSLTNTASILFVKR